MTPLARHCAIVMAYSRLPPPPDAPPEVPERVHAGDRWHMLTVIERAGYNTGGAALWRCKCDCGGETTARPWDLKTGNKKSCGCLRGRNGR